MKTIKLSTIILGFAMSLSASIAIANNPTERPYFPYTFTNTGACTCEEMARKKLPPHPGYPPISMVQACDLGHTSAIPILFIGPEREPNEEKDWCKFNKKTTKWEGTVPAGAEGWYACR